MHRAGVVAGVLALASLVVQPVWAHPGPVDARGGHICRPEGGGASDCAGFGLEPGQYHCEGEPCAQEVERTAQVWCTFGIPVPLRSSMVGAFPTGDFTPRIRVVRLGGPGHVLQVERNIEPKVQGPEGCLIPDPGLELEVADVGAHLGARGPEVWGAARPVGRASTSLVPLPDKGPGDPAPHAAGALVALALLVMVTDDRRRPHAYWEPHRR